MVKNTGKNIRKLYEQINMCLYPRLIDNPKYKPNKKNGYNPPKCTDDRVKLVPIGCQRCMECRKQKGRGWQARLTEDIKHNTNAKFITLTFSNESIQKLMKQMDKVNVDGYELDNEIATQGVRYFLERWRKKYKVSIRHWLVTELGHEGTENIHLHGLIWVDEKLYTVNQKTGEIKGEAYWRDEIQKIWGYGYVWTGKPKRTGETNGELINYVNEQTINYITKYVFKTDDDHQYYNPKILTSAGIGRDYTKTFDFKQNAKKKQPGETRETYRTRDGIKINLPIYWRNKRYSEKEREELWIEKIDSGIRWIRGHKLINPTGEELMSVLNYYRAENKRMGYGDDEKDWNREQYERQRRRLMRDKRLKKEIDYNAK